MKRFQINRPNTDDNVCSSSTYIIGHIFPLCIKERDKNTFSILFLVQNNTQGEEVKEYLTMFFSYDNDEDRKFISTHTLNYKNIINNQKQFKMYMEMMDSFDSRKLYSTDLDFNVFEEKKMYYYCYGYRVVNETNSQIEELKMLLNRSLFVQLNLFFVRFINHDITAETVFFDYTLHKVDYVTIDSIKYNGSAKPNPGSDYVISHYSTKVGKEQYKFHFISTSILGRRLKNALSYDSYTSLYKDDPFIDMMFMDYNSNTLFIIYIEKNKVDGKYKRTLALKLSEELYHHTNFLDIYKIYVDVKEK